jgi:hypothetical protein
MIAVHERTGRPVVALLRIRPEQASLYGVATVTPGRPPASTSSATSSRSRVRRTPRRTWRSSAATSCRARSSSTLRETPPGRGGEIQLTDALNAMAHEEPIIGLELDVPRYDAGDKLGFLEATVALAAEREDLGPTSSPGCDDGSRSTTSDTLRRARPSGGHHRGRADAGRRAPRRHPRRCCRTPEPIELKLADALGLVLAEDLVSQVRVPDFANAAMDGYAVVVADLEGATSTEPIGLPVVGEVAAGSARATRSRPGGRPHHDRVRRCRRGPRRSSRSRRPPAAAARCTSTRPSRPAPTCATRARTCTRPAAAQCRTPDLAGGHRAAGGRRRLPGPVPAAAARRRAVERRRAGPCR